MKLDKFELEKMPVAEMNAIKAGSGVSGSVGGFTVSTGTDHTSSSQDRD